jgi:hypothetical protein
MRRVIVYLSSYDIKEFIELHKLVFSGSPVLSDAGEETGEFVTVEVRPWVPDGEQ